MFKQTKLRVLTLVLKIIEEVTLIYLGLERRSISVREQRIVFYITKCFRSYPVPTVILIHGFGGDKNHWLPVSRFLKHSFNLIILDVPGFGESSMRESFEYTLSTQVELITEFLTKISPHSKYIIGGSSLGGFLAAAIAVKVPNQTCGLWLLAPAGVTTEHHAEGVELILQGDNPLLVNNESEFARLSQLCFHEVPPKNLFYEVFEQRAIKRLLINEQLFMQMFGPIDSIEYQNPFKLEELVQSLECETLLVWGNEDKILTSDGLDILSKKIKSNESKLMQKVGHLPMLEEPKRCAKDLTDFYRERIDTLS